MRLFIKTLLLVCIGYWAGILTYVLLVKMPRITELDLVNALLGMFYVPYGIRLFGQLEEAR